MTILASVDPEQILRDAGDFVITCPAYPGAAGEYGGEFVRSRVVAYGERGRHGTIVEFSRRNATTALESVAGTPVLRVSPDSVEVIAELLQHTGTPVLSHSPSPQWQTAVLDRLEPQRVVVWFHGFEVRDYRRLYANRSMDELARGRSILDADNFQRFDAARRLFREPRLRKVFVSDFLRRMAEFDVGVKAVNVSIIPTFIDSSYFVARPRGAADAQDVLLMRSFAARNYANDIALKALGILSTRPGFEDLRITVRGFGRLFRTETEELRGIPNIAIEERYSTPSEMAALHYDHGIFLCPSRFDTQGVTLGEAMASGMVCVTNEVAAIPEFVDESCARLVRPDDPWAFAEAIWDLVRNPDQMESLSQAAAARVREVCGFDRTIGRELSLLAEAST